MIRRVIAALTLTCLGAIVVGARGAREAREEQRSRVTRTIAFETDEGTDMNVDVSPDGKEILFDLLGDLYTMPIGGGRAKLLLGGRHWDSEPTYSPDGKRILFVSDRAGGVQSLWTVDRDGKSPTLVVTGDTFLVHTPHWSRDGSEIAIGHGAVVSRGAIVDVASRRIDSVSPGKATSARRPGFVYAMSFSHDKTSIFYSEGAGNPYSDEGYHSWLYRFDRATRSATLLTDTEKKFHEFTPIVSPSGRWLAYGRRTPDGRTALRVRALGVREGEGEDRELVPLPDADDPFRWADQEDSRPSYAFMPDESAVVIAIGGKIHRVPVDGSPATAIPFQASVSQEVLVPVVPRPPRLMDGPVSIRAIRTPVITPDGRTLIFTAVGRLWIEDRASKKIRRLTDAAELEYSPSISPDGRWLTYLAYNDTIPGQLAADTATTPRPARFSRLMLVSLEGNLPGRAPAPRALTEPGDLTSPTWFADSRRILFTSTSGATGLPLRGAAATPTRSMYVWTDINGGKPTPLFTASAGLRDLTGTGPVKIARVVSSGRIYGLEAGRQKADKGYGSLHEDFKVVSFKLDGTDRRVHGTIVANPITVAISPTATHLFLASRMGNGAYIVPIPESADSTRRLALSDPSVTRVSTLPVAHGWWQDATTIVFGIGPNLLRATIGKRTAVELPAVELRLPRARPKGTFAIRGARILTMAGAGVIDRGTLLVRDGRIAAVDDASRVTIPKDAMVIDGGGLTITPGFIDTHFHVGHRFTPRPAIDPEPVSGLAYGVTTAYNATGTGPEADREYFERVETGSTVGPRYYSAGTGLTHGDYPISSLDDARALVAFYAAFGVVELKEYLQPSREQRQWLAQAAEEKGLGITAHVGGLNQTLMRVADGFTAWEHSPFIAPLYQDAATFIARSGVIWTPTLMVQQATSGGQPQGSSLFYRDMLRDSPVDTIKFQRTLWSGYAKGYMGDYTTPLPAPFDSARIGHAARSAAAVIAAGGLVSVGAHNAPGLFTQWEMWSIRRGGASVMDALRAGTINNAKKLGIDRDVGSLEVGKLADIVVLTANPLEDIRNTTKIRYVVADAVIYDAATMTQLWPSYKPLPRMGWQTVDAYRRLPVAPPLPKERP